MATNRGENNNEINIKKNEINKGMAKNMLQNEYYIDSYDIIFLLSSVVSDPRINSIQFQTLCIKLSYFNGNALIEQTCRTYTCIY
jgi:hypothetical protein